MQNEEERAAPAYCWKCGEQVMAWCIFEDGNFDPYCPHEECGGLDGTEPKKMYFKVLEGWFDNLRMAYGEERDEERYYARTAR